MNTHHKITDLIEIHRQVVLVDEKSYDDDGHELDIELAYKTGAAEAAAFKAMAEAPCLSHDDVQAKISYLLNGSIGERTPLMECLGYDEYGGWDSNVAFLKSLMIPEGSR